jgi:hypothetical protein
LVERAAGLEAAELQSKSEVLQLPISEELPCKNSEPQPTVGSRVSNWPIRIKRRGIKQDRERRERRRVISGREKAQASHGNFKCWTAGHTQAATTNRELHSLSPQDKWSCKRKETSATREVS